MNELTRTVKLLRVLSSVLDTPYECLVKSVTCCEEVKLNASQVAKLLMPVDGVTPLKKYELRVDFVDKAGMETIDLLDDEEFYLQYEVTLEQFKENYGVYPHEYDARIGGLPSEFTLYAGVEESDLECLDDLSEEFYVKFA